MRKKTVRSKLDLTGLPLLTLEQESELTALRALKDGDIDLSDAPELDSETFAKAMKNPYLKTP